MGTAKPSQNHFKATFQSAIPQCWHMPEHTCCCAVNLPPRPNLAVSRFEAAAYGSFEPVVAPNVAAARAAAAAGFRGGHRIGDQSVSVVLALAEVGEARPDLLPGASVPVSSHQDQSRRAAF
eukprot:COSAG05_NODE_204_length_14187_cov_99.887422_15_plen_122_part_00